MLICTFMVYNIPLMFAGIKKHYTEQELKFFLVNKHKISYLSEFSRKHIDSCQVCWELWNKVRWDNARQGKGLVELKEYMGDSFREYFDSSWALAREWNKKNPTTFSEIADFYKNTHNYLFNLVIWHESGDREPFSDELQKLLKKFELRSVIDYGCGVGTDSLFLIEKGVKTFMIDYISPTTDFLQWRLKKRSLNGEFMDVEKVKTLPKADMFWAVDVLEHLPDPTRVVNLLDDETKVFAHRSQFNDQAGGRHPCHIINFEEQRLTILLKEKGFVNIPWKNLSVWVKSELI